MGFARLIYACHASKLKQENIKKEFLEITIKTWVWNCIYIHIYTYVYIYIYTPILYLISLLPFKPQRGRRLASLYDLSQGITQPILLSIVERKKPPTPPQSPQNPCGPPMQPSLEGRVWSCPPPRIIKHMQSLLNIIFTKLFF